jgi:hypothetical protein
VKRSAIGINRKTEEIRILRIGRGHKVAKRLRHYAATWKVAGSRPDKVNEFLFFFNLLNPSSHTRSTEELCLHVWE